MADNANFAEVGTSGLAQYNGIVRDDFLKEFTGKEAYKRYNEMRLNSPIIASGLSALEYIVRRMTWSFSGEAEDPRHELLEDARAAMTMSWNDHISEVLSFIPFGFYICEKVYQRDAKGRILWRKFATRGQDTVHQWIFDENGGVQGIVQMAAPSYRMITIPIEKLLIYRTRMERGNPEGRSLLRAAWIPYYYTKNLQQIEAIGYERDLNGMPVIKLPAGANTDTNSSSSDLAVAQKMVRNIRNDEQAGATLPDGWALELLSGAGKGFGSLAEAIKRYESRTAMVFFSQSLLLGQDGSGSLALSVNMKTFLATFADAIADIIAETFSKYAIPQLLMLNGYTEEQAREIKLEHTPAGEVDISSLAESVSKIGSLLTWDENDEAWLRNMAGLPERKPEELAVKREEEKARKQAMADAIKSGVGNPPQRQPEQDHSHDGETPSHDGEDASQLAADFYRARNPRSPDDYKRRKMEKELKVAIEKHLAKTKRRVIAEAKGLQQRTI